MKNDKRSQRELARDAGLDADSLRLMQRARDTFGVEELTAETAVQAAKNLREKLAAMPKDARLGNQKALHALMDDLNDLRARLRAEQSLVQAQISHRAQSVKANVAYLHGAVSCPSK